MPPFDPVAIAEAAIARPRRRTAIRPRLTLLVAAALLLGGTVGLAAYAGGRLMSDPLPAPSPTNHAVIGPLPSPSTEALLWTDGAAPQFLGATVGNANVWRTDLATGKSTNVVLYVLNPTIAPDGRHVAYVGTDGIHVVSTEGGPDVVLQRTLPTEPQCVPKDPACDYPDGELAWSPDGRWLGWGECGPDTTCRAHVSSADGSIQMMPKLSQLKAGTGFIWSGDHLEFFRSTGWSVMDVPGSEERSLASSTWFSSDGTLVATTKNDGFSPSTATTLSISTAAGANLGHTDFPADRYIVLPPQWSPTNDSVAVLLGWSMDHFMGPLTIVDLRGAATPARLEGEQIEDGSLVWSPDGRRVYAQGGSASSNGVDGLIIDRDGTLEADLGRVPRRVPLGDGAAVAWSPDGSRLAFVDIDGTMVVVDADGRHASPLRGLPGVPATSIVWSCCR